MVRLGLGLGLGLAIGCRTTPAATPAPTPAPAGNGSTGSFSSGSAGSGTATGATVAVECPSQKCGPALGVKSTPCADGSLAGPTGRCVEHADQTCGWEVRACK